MLHFLLKKTPVKKINMKTVNAANIHASLMLGLQNNLKPDVSPGTVGLTIILLAVHFEALSKHIPKTTAANYVTNIVKSFDERLFSNRLQNNADVNHSGWSDTTVEAMANVTDILINSLYDNFKDDFYVGIVVRTMAAMSLTFVMIHLCCSPGKAKDTLLSYLADATEEQLSAVSKQVGVKNTVRTVMNG